ALVVAGAVHLAADSDHLPRPRDEEHVARLQQDIGGRIALENDLLQVDLGGRFTPGSGLRVPGSGLGSSTARSTPRERNWAAPHPRGELGARSAELPGKPDVTARGDRGDAAGAGDRFHDASERAHQVDTRLLDFAQDLNLETAQPRQADGGAEGPR